MAGLPRNSPHFIRDFMRFPAQGAWPGMPALPDRMVGMKNASDLTHRRAVARLPPRVPARSARVHGLSTALPPKPPAQSILMSATTVPFPMQSRMFGKYFEYARYPDVVEAMHAMLASIPDGQACILSSMDGHHLAHSAAPMLDAVRLAAVSSSLCGLGQTLTRDLSQQGFVDVTVRTHSGLMLIQCLPRPGHQLVMMTATGHGANPDLLANLSRQCASTIAALCLPASER
jgi:predicted regulator of Ras-like GTPase activity (Roadblock/LC7/MglB family)